MLLRLPRLLLLLTALLVVALLQCDGAGWITTLRESLDRAAVWLGLRTDHRGLRPAALRAERGERLSSARLHRRGDGGWRYVQWGGGLAQLLLVLAGLAPCVVRGYETQKRYITTQQGRCLYLTYQHRPRTTVGKQSTDLEDVVVTETGAAKVTEEGPAMGLFECDSDGALLTTFDAITHHGRNAQSVLGLARAQVRKISYTCLLGCRCLINNSHLSRQAQDKYEFNCPVLTEACSHRIAARRSRRLGLWSISTWVTTRESGR